jgi:nicotinic acid mononucleotide adenylyltransferase
MPVSELPRALPALAGRMVDASAARGASADEQTSILLVDAPTSPVSSTDVRSAIARGASLEGLLPTVIADYIARHGLYQNTREGHESGKEPHEDTATPPAS